MTEAKTFSAPPPYQPRAHATAGVHDLPAELYHGDPCEQPSLSASIAHILCTASPLHAWTAHPRLNPGYRPRESERFDIGTVAHAIVLQGADIVRVIDAPDWRTKEARELRDAARSEGRVPLLTHVLAEVEAMVEAIKIQLANHRAEPPLFMDGKPEQTLVWEEPGGVTCRARLDWLRDDRATIDDLKTTSRSANPEAYSRNLFSIGADIQAAFYIRGVQEIYGVTPAFRWCVVESTPPYALSVVSPGPDVLALAKKKVYEAIDVWRRCLASGNWPGYPRDVCTAELPAWEESRWLERELREAA